MLRAAISLSLFFLAWNGYAQSPEPHFFDSTYVATPASAQVGHTVEVWIVDTVPKGTFCSWDGTIYLHSGSARIKGSVISARGFDSILAQFAIPSTTPPGYYDFYLPLTIECVGDTLILPHAFRIDPASSVSADPVYQLPDFLQPISNVRVLDNPTSDMLTITFTLSNQTFVRFVVYDPLGRTIAVLYNGSLTPGQEQFEWATEKIAAGSYFYELRTANQQVGGRIVVRH